MSSADPNAPELQFQAPSALRRWGDSFARLTLEPDGDRALRPYYTKLNLKPDGTIELMHLGSTGHDTDDIWSDNAAVIAGVSVGLTSQ